MSLDLPSIRSIYPAGDALNVPWPTKFEQPAIFRLLFSQFTPRRSTIRPERAEIKEPVIMPSFASSVRSPDEKERPEIKRDMVNPIPPSMLTPVICRQLTPEGSGALNILKAIKANREIPRGFPITNPSIIPRSPVLRVLVTYPCL